MFGFVFYLSVGAKILSFSNENPYWKHCTMKGIAVGSMCVVVSLIYLAEIAFRGYTRITLKLSNPIHIQLKPKADVSEHM